MGVILDFYNDILQRTYFLNTPILIKMLYLTAKVFHVIKKVAKSRKSRFMRRGYTENDLYNSTTLAELNWNGESFGCNVNRCCRSGIMLYICTPLVEMYVRSSFYSTFFLLYNISQFLCLHLKSQNFAVTTSVLSFLEILLDLKIVN